MEVSLPQAKLLFPAVRIRRVQRPRLHERLDGLLTRKLAVICGPAGYGKTTLAADWLDHLAQRQDIAVPQIAWLSLDASDSEPARFFSALIAALEPVYPAAGHNLLPLANAQTLDWIEPLLITLLNDIAAFPNQCVLTLDDYHLIGDRTIHDALDFMIDHLPPQLHLLICTRADPPLALHRLRARDELVELGQAQLCFAPDQAADFVRRVMAIDLSPDQVQRLTERTEGWIAGLQLAALSLRDADAGERDRLVQAFTGTQRQVTEFLLNEVLLRQSNAVRTFLLRTAILDRFCGSLCDAVVDEPTIDGNATLQYLAHNQVFLVPLDASQRWFRYHHLFRDLLQERLARQSPGLAPTLHLRASDWFHAHGQDHQAIDQALAAGAPERAAQLIDGLGCRLIQEGSDVQTLAWIEQIPQPLHRHFAWLRVAQLVSLCGLERYDKLMPLLDGLATDADLFPGLPIPTCVLLVRAWHLMRTAYEPETLLRYGLTARAQLTDLPENDTTWLLQALAQQYIGHGHWNLGRRAQAEQAFAEGVRVSRAAQSVAATLRALIQLALFYQAVGPLRRCAEICQQGIDLAQEATLNQPQTPPPADLVAMLEGLLGLMLLLWDDLPQAQTHVERAVALFQQSGSQPGHYLEFGLINLFWVLSAREQHARAYAVLRQIDDFMLGCSPSVRWQVEPKLVRLRIAMSHMGTAWRPLLHRVESWVNDNCLDAEHPERHQGRHYEAMGCGLLALGRIAEAAVWLERGLSKTSQQGWILGELLFASWLAAAREQLGDGSGAEEALLRALELAEPEECLQIFTEHGPWTKAVMQRLQARLRRGDPTCRGVHLSFVESILPLFLDSYDVPGTAATMNVPTALIEPPSAREMDVLRLLALGKRNQEIADTLYVTPNTVSFHLKNLFGKLEVHNRTEAVAVARRLALIG